MPPVLGLDAFRGTSSRWPEQDGLNLTHRGPLPHFSRARRLPKSEAAIAAFPRQRLTATEGRGALSRTSVATRGTFLSKGLGEHRPLLGCGLPHLEPDGSGSWCCVHRSSSSDGQAVLSLERGSNRRPSNGLEPCWPLGRRQLAARWLVGAWISRGPRREDITAATRAIPACRRWSGYFARPLRRPNRTSAWH